MDLCNCFETTFFKVNRLGKCYRDCEKFGYETAEVSKTHCSWISNKKFGFSKGNLIVWNFLAGKDFLHSFYSITLPEGPCCICKHLVAVQKLRVHLTERVTSTLHTNVLHQPIKVRLHACCLME